LPFLGGVVKEGSPREKRAMMFGRIQNAPDYLG